MKPRLMVVIATAILLASCGTTTAPQPTSTAAATLHSTTTSTAIPATTAAPTETSTPLPTATPQPTATPTPAPTETSTPAPTRTLPPPTATRKPTQEIPTATVATATATTAPASSVVIPPPEIFSFDPGGFMKYLNYAHEKYQMATASIGGLTHRKGECRWFIQLRNEMMAIPNFTGAPEPWSAMVAEYATLRTQAFILIDPINQVCNGGGGTIAEEPVRQMIDFFNQSQNRMYEMLQQAKALTQ